VDWRVCVLSRGGADMMTMTMNSILTLPLQKKKGKLNLHAAQAVTLNLHMQLG